MKNTFTKKNHYAVSRLKPANSNKIQSQLVKTHSTEFLSSNLRVDYTCIYSKLSLEGSSLTSFAHSRRCDKMTTLITLILEPGNVHGRILAVNMAHLRKKRQTAENSSLSDISNSSLGDNGSSSLGEISNSSLGDNGSSSLGDISNSSLGRNAFHGIQEANKGKEVSAK